ncbi:hypothetical protein M406DRAFT_75088 [Cryphonectria parasitica EP155]|uniref:Uncharacterized protein n=1 Tax=Cryphonectria parasitica (strain ATCC 38755 / EP155) TaxID=660469 RepID=A0A9P4XZX9_CRYP1|nr:uncharacterized protein M406DRAFT_75088 [Cryphonectria parasitica EP155]KAF3763855.1 hypothetical protein M406DRAFT_75088 [Cryphonectria parasitica EP155]
MMFSLSTLLTGVIAAGSVLASPIATPAAAAAAASTSCATPVATVTTPALHLVCRFACVKPTATCAPGQPTAPVPSPPTTSTIAPAGACTVTLEVFSTPACNNCATCVSPAATLQARETQQPSI